MKPIPVDESASPVPTGQQSRPLTESAMADSSALSGMMEKFQSMSPSMGERNAAETEQAKQQTRLAKARFELSPSLRRADRRMAARERAQTASADKEANDRERREAFFARGSYRMDEQQMTADARRKEASEARAARSLSYQQLKQPAAAPSGMNEPQITQAAVGYVDPNGQYASRIANIVTGQYGTAVGGAPVAGPKGYGRNIGNEYYGNSREALLTAANKTAQSRASQPAPRMTAQSAVSPKKNPLMPN